MKLFSFLLFLSISFLLRADWQENFEQELRDLGYTQEEIDAALTQEKEFRRLKKTPKNPPAESVKPPSSLSSDGQSKESLLDELRSLGFAGNRLERQMRIVQRLSGDKRDQHMAKLEDQHKKELWIQKHLQPRIELLKTNGWQGAQLKKRSAREEQFFDELFASVNDSQDKESEIVSKAQTAFEEKLAYEYLEEANKKMAVKFPKKMTKELAQSRSEYVHFPREKRVGLIRNLANQLQIKQQQSREKEFSQISKMLVFKLKAQWGAQSLSFNKRIRRKDDVLLLCQNLSFINDKDDFDQVLDKNLKAFKRQGYSKQELKIIEKNLEGLSP